MKRKNLLKLVGAIILAVVIAIPLTVGCAAPEPVPGPPGPAGPAGATGAPGAPAPEELPELELVFATFLPKVGAPGYPRAIDYPLDMIETVVPRVKFTRYPAGTLVAAKDEYRSLQEGIIDFAGIFSPTVPGALPLIDVVSLPGLFTENMETNGMILNELFEKYPQFEEQFSPKVKRIASQTFLRADLHATAPIYTLADLKGKIIGAHNTAAAEALIANGASASVIMNPDMYTAGETGVVDAVVCPWGAVESFKLYEVYQYHTKLGISPGVWNWCFNRDTWNKFTEEEQARIELLRAAFQQANISGIAVGIDTILKEYVTPELGHVVIEWSKEDSEKFRENVRPDWDKWVEEVEAMGYPGTEIIEDVLYLLKKYDLA